MRYSDPYLFSHDIDWYCNVNGIYIHVASAGGRLPTQINDDITLRRIQYQVEQLPDIFSDEEIIYNDVVIANVLGQNGEKDRWQYIESFSAMARKGFASFDRTNIANPDDNRYHLVCFPNNFERKPEGLDVYTVNGNININDLMSSEFHNLIDYIGGLSIG